MENRILTCIVCPRGCQLTVKFDESGKIEKIDGNACKRGAVYAEDECTHPMRTVTSTVRCEGGAIISVKTSGTVPKEKIFEVMREINLARAADNVKIGEVVIKNICSLGVDLIATSNA